MAVSSPAYHYADPPISLDRALVRNVPATFYVTAQGEDMREDGICHNALLVVDRSIRPFSGAVVVVALAGELLVNRWIVAADGSVSLVTSDPKCSPLRLAEFPKFTVLGVVTFAINGLAHMGWIGMPPCARAAGHLPMSYV